MAKTENVASEELARYYGEGRTLNVSALERGVVAAWDRQLTRPAFPLGDRAMARIAVHEVLSALRANPAWCRALRVGG